MARLVAAFGSSHSVMLTCQLEDWLGKFEEADLRLPLYDEAGNKMSFAEVQAVAPADAKDRITAEGITARYHATHKAMASLRDQVQAAKLDVLVIVGDDQYELFHDEAMPAMGVYYGATIRNEVATKFPPEEWYRRAQMKRLEDEQEKFYPCDPKLAEYLLKGLVTREFDMTAVAHLNARQFERHPYEGHAYAFIHQTYLKGTDLPIVPIFLNTYNPPNQPTPKRCVALGAALRDLIAAYPADLRVGIMASGGLSHFRVEEDMDKAIIEACRTHDLDYLAGLQPHRLLAGSSEIRNWIVVASAARDLDLTWQAYIPGYRTTALTGTGLGFVRWGQPGA